MSRQDDATRRALDALKGDAGEHPGHEVLEAYVEGRLDEDQQTEVERLAARSLVVAEDIADLAAMHSALVGARPDNGWRRMAAVAAVAAGVLLAVWVMTPSRIDAPRSVIRGDENARVTAAMTAGRVVLPAGIAALGPREGTLLGAAEPARFGLQTPVGSAVLSTRPLFTWDDARADAYTVAVFDQNFSEVTRGRTDSPSWRPDVDLPRGGTYSWQVTAHRGTENITQPRPPRPEARFTIVDSATAARISEMQQRLANEPLALGVLLAESGLIVDARIQFERAAQNPETAEIARRLRSSLDQGTPITTKPAQ